MPTTAIDPTIISSFSNAIAQGEGFNADSSNRPTRTMNPGDIGNTDTSSQSYASLADGWAALDHQVQIAMDGTSNVYNPNMTVAQFGATYAPGGTLATNLPKLLGVSPDTTLAQIASGSVAINNTPRPGGTDPGGTSTTATTPAYLTDDNDPAVALPVQGVGIPSDQIAGVLAAVNVGQSQNLIINSGLDQAAWNANPGILQVNKATAAVGSPVTFRIFFDVKGQPLPVVLSLNASLRTHQRTMRHITSRQKTLTAMLVNLWGMSPDQISGQASTGLFANQLGVTDFLSLSTAPDSLKQQVLKAFTQDLNTSDTIETAMDANSAFFRIAAKDAFIEFLSMFKNNGSVWFRNQNYTGYTTGNDQVAVDAWSPSTGSTTFQNAARRNDVMTRGKVVMYFRNSAYYGYFKNLSWTMDAANPFRWNFNFVFQVESTQTNLQVPQT